MTPVLVGLLVAGPWISSSLVDCSRFRTRSYQKQGFLSVLRCLIIWIIQSGSQSWFGNAGRRFVDSGDLWL